MLSHFIGNGSNIGDPRFGATARNSNPACRHWDQSVSRCRHDPCVGFVAPMVDELGNTMFPLRICPSSPPQNACAIAILPPSTILPNTWVSCEWRYKNQGQGALLLTSDMRYIATIPEQPPPGGSVFMSFDYFILPEHLEALWRFRARLMLPSPTPLIDTSQLEAMSDDQRRWFAFWFDNIFGHR